MTKNQKLVVCFDIDDTLLDNDQMEADLSEFLMKTFGANGRDRYHELFEATRSEFGYADFLGASERFRMDDIHEPLAYDLSNWLLDYPFPTRLYPHALDAIESVKPFGTPIIVSDGDGVYQPHKIARSGLQEIFQKRVLIYIHKENEIADIERHYPSAHYVFVDDKIKILSSLKEQWGDRVTTVFVTQGHYANDAALRAQYPEADVTLDGVGDLRGIDLSQLA